MILITVNHTKQQNVYKIIIIINIIILLSNLLLQNKQIENNNFSNLF